MTYPASYLGRCPWFGGMEARGHTASEAALGIWGHVEDTGRARRAFVPD